VRPSCVMSLDEKHVNRPMEKNEKELTPLTAEQLVRRIDNEGLSYAVTSYYGRDIQCTDDEKLDALWKAAYDAIDALEQHVSLLRDKMEGA